MIHTYNASYWGFWLVLVTLLVQWGVASFVKAKQPGAIPGKIEDNLSHDAFVFRAHRTFMNSLENMPLFLGAYLLAILTGVSATITAICVWVFAVARIFYTLLYYVIQTEENPSPRTFLFLIALLANLYLLLAIALHLL